MVFHLEVLEPNIEFAQEQEEGKVLHGDGLHFLYYTNLGTGILCA